MKAPVFVWLKSGRSWVAHVGKLKLVVDERGRRGVNQRWRVSSVFGHCPFSGSHPSLDAAILEAEKLAVRVGLPALKKLQQTASKEKTWMAEQRWELPGIGVVPVRAPVLGSTKRAAAKDANRACREAMAVLQKRTDPAGKPVGNAVVLYAMADAPLVTRER